MKKLKIVIALMVFTCLGLVGTGTASAAQSGFRAYVSCVSSAGATPSDTCVTGSSLTAFFMSRSARVKYRVCVRYPSGVKGCTRKRTAKAGVLYANPIPSSQIGRYRVVWTFGKKKHRIRTFTITG